MELKERPYRMIKLTNGAYAKVDVDDYAEMAKYSWNQSPDGYAQRSIYLNGKTTTITMHRQIIRTPHGKHTDHINHDRLDNTRANLRIVEPRENILNRRNYDGANNPFYGKTHSHEYRCAVAKRFAKKVAQLDKSGELIRVWDSIMDVQRGTGMLNCNISLVCTGKRKQAYGYCWRYV